MNLRLVETLDKSKDGKQIFNYGSQIGSKILNSIQRSSDNRLQAQLFAAQTAGFHLCETQFSLFEDQIACKIGVQEDVIGIAGFSDIWMPRSTEDYIGQINGDFYAMGEKPIPMFDMKTLDR